MKHTPADIDRLTFNRTYELFSSRWKVYLLYAIGSEVYRMGELRRLFPMISRVTLTSYLQELEQDGFVERTAYPAPPLRTDYSLTPLGISALPYLTQLIQWGAAH
mgnify:CR=1 FL=1